MLPNFSSDLSVLALWFVLEWTNFFFLNQETSSFEITYKQKEPFTLKKI